MKNKYFVEAVIGRKRAVLGYGVYDCVGGLQSEHQLFKVPEYSAEVALFLANSACDDLNKSIALSGR